MERTKILGLRYLLNRAPVPLESELVQFKGKQGPVVQGIVSLMSLLRSVQSVFYDFIT